jgi:hypothetical protein
VEFVAFRAALRQVFSDYYSLPYQFSFHHPLHIHIVLTLTASLNKLERGFATVQLKYCKISIEIRRTFMEVVSVSGIALVPNDMETY